MQLATTTQDAIKLQIAAQLAPRQWRDELDKVRAGLAKGHDWPAAIAEVDARQAELRQLLSAALAAGDPTGILLKLLQHRATARISWRQLITTLVYPLVLLLAALFLGSLMSVAMLGLVTKTWENDKRFSAFPETILDRAVEFYDASIGGLFLVGWCCAIIGIAYWLATPNAWLKLVGSVPVLGRPYRWMVLSEVLTRISVFSQSQPTLEKALELTAQSFGSQAPASIGRYLVQAIHRGEALPNAIHKTIISDARAGMALTLIDSTDLSASTLAASRLIDEMILATCQQLRLILPVFIMILVASIIWSTWSSYFEILSAFRNSFFYF